MARTYIWKDPRPAARWAQAFLWAQLVAAPIAAATPFLLLWVLRSRVRDFGDPEDLQAALIEGAQSGLIFDLVMLVYVALFVAGAVTAGRWTFRAASNARVLDPDTRYGPWGSVIWYFVPVANLVFPFAALRETWRVSGGLTVRREGLLVCWWLFLWASPAFDLGGDWLVGQLVPSNPLVTPSSWRLMLPLVLDAVEAVMAVIASLAFLLITRSITRLQVSAFAAHVFGEKP